MFFLEVVASTRPLHIDVVNVESIIDVAIDVRINVANVDNRRRTGVVPSLFKGYRDQRLGAI